MSNAVKRAFDLMVVLPLLIMGMPFFAVLGLMVAMDGGPIIYGHPRIGRSGKLFRCYKFRTMIEGAHDLLDEYLSLHPTRAYEWRDNQKLDSDPRITGIGRFLRCTSLDELPQFFNVLRGEMSLVGPRPVTEPELRRYGEYAKSYISIRPGITGLWQVSGRNRLTYDQRVALDMEYIAKRSLWRDFVIMLQTVRVLWTGDGK